MSRVLYWLWTFMAGVTLISGVLAMWGLYHPDPEYTAGAALFGLAAFYTQLAGWRREQL